MKKFYLIIVLWSLIQSSFALEPLKLAPDFTITQHWLSWTTSFDIHRGQQKIGRLYRRMLTPTLTYDFYDENNEKVAYSKAKIFSISAKFDVYDKSHQRIGMIKEKLFRFFPTFCLYSNDGTRLADACLNFWGTTFTIYDAITEEEIATMSRGLFRLKNAWDIHITNPALFEARKIHPYLFLTALAFQGDRENWQQDDSNMKQMDAILKANLGAQADNNQQALVAHQPDLMEIWAKRWDQRFKTTYPDYVHQDRMLNFDRMLKIGLELLHSPQLNALDRQALEDLFHLIAQTGKN